MNILMTGFDPFGGEQINPSWEAVSRVKAPEGTELIKVQIPTVFAKAGAAAVEAIRKYHPDAVLCVGQSGRALITPERIAINVDDADIADNEGAVPKDVPINEFGPAAYFSTLPIKKMTKAINDAGIGAAVSDTAGTFVCNHLMYSVLDFLAKEAPTVPGGFIHVPRIPAQTAGKDLPCMELEQIVRGLEAAISAIA